MEPLEHMMMTPAPTARRPLLGLTVLVVEDSRFASESLRLLCLRSGARIRRADSLETAKRHLAIYRPSVLMVDLGLPDGSGLALIETLAAASPRIDVILGTSGDPTAQGAVISAGADGFLSKPIASIAAFQSAILQHLPADRQPPAPRAVSTESVHPDPIAYQDDLNHIAAVLNDNDADHDIGYVTQFLGSVARSAEDHDLDQAVRALVQRRRAGQDSIHEVSRLSALVQSRLTAGGRV
ncbi:response regulator [Yoonia sp. 2307UL14-13]|uniref:response regulator n=1 Tax=Yoonia sp. 2307UL14-13 TaxID=3126506 RepID=UPI0030959DD2